MFLKPNHKYKKNKLCHLSWHFNKVVLNDEALSKF